MSGDKYFGRHLSDNDAQLVMALLAEIEADKGRLTTAEVAKELVRRSRPKDSPTHHMFTWDDHEAADAYRLDQARFLVRSVYVVFEEQPEQKPVRAMVNIVHGGKRGPMPMRRVLQSTDLTQQLLEKAQEDLQIWASRYEALRKLADLKHVFVAIDRVAAAAAQRAVKKTPSRKHASKSQSSARA